MQDNPLFKRATQLSKDGINIYQQRLKIGKMCKGQRVARGAMQLEEIMDDDRSLMTEEFSVMSEEDIQRQKSQKLTLN